MNKPVVLPQRIVEKMEPKERKALGLKTRAEMTESCEYKAEKVIQSEVESWLRLRGYCPRSPAFLDGKVPRRGWYIHLHKTKKNPILLDLFIISGERCLELELKADGGELSPEQVAILNSDGTALAWSTPQAIETVIKWEKKNGIKESNQHN